MNIEVWDGLESQNRQTWIMVWHNKKYMVNLGIRISLVFQAHATKYSLTWQSPKLQWISRSTFHLIQLGPLGRWEERRRRGWRTTCTDTTYLCEYVDSSHMCCTCAQGAKNGPTFVIQLAISYQLTPHNTNNTLWIPRNSEFLKGS